MSGKPKNLLLLLADQFRHDALGSVNSLARTPNLDRLAAGGARFTNAYTPLPVCAPARQALVTGRHPDSFGAFWNYNFFATPPIAPVGTWPMRMKEKGMEGLFVGKWNVAEEGGPEAFGFDKVVSGGAYDAFCKARYPDLAYTGGWMGCESPLPLADAKTHWYARKSLELIEAEGEKPWFLWLDFGMPHLPCRPSAPFSTMYDPCSIPKWPGYDDSFVDKPYCHAQQAVNWRLEDMPWAEMARQVARYFGMVSQIDDAIGLLLNGLRERGLLADTLVVFTSDHGDMCGNHRMFDKHYVLYDDIVRVPLIVAGPGAPRAVDENLVSNCLDLPYTICDLFDLGAVEGHGQPLFGAPPRRAISSSGNGQQFGFFNTRMLTDGRWKYVWNLTDTDELYDLQTDPGEVRNRVNEPAQAARLAEMRRRLYDDLTAHDDPFLHGDWIAAQLTENRKVQSRRIPL